MKIEHNGAEWCGTFANTVRLALTDILHDGPIDNVTVETDGGVTPIEAGRLLEFEDDVLVMLPRGGVVTVQIRLDDVLAVSF